MVKILGGSLVLIAAYLFGMKLMEPAAEHIRLLEEGDLLYRMNRKYVIQERRCLFYLES